MEWLEGIIKWDPDQLSRLEYFLGPLAIDWPAGEAMGAIFRPPLQGPARGNLRPQVKRLVVSLAIDIYHQDPREPRDYRIASCDLDLDVGHATVAHVLAQRFSTTRAVSDSRRAYTEFGGYYLAANPDASAFLLWNRERPTWALPKRIAGGAEHLLEVLCDRLITDTQPRAIFAALEPVVANTGCELCGPDPARGRSGVDLRFNPALELATVVRALRLVDPTASSYDVHRSSWHVETAGPDGRIDAPRIGTWALDIILDGWPRGANGAQLADRGHAGPSPRLDLAGCATPVGAIAIDLPRR